MGTNKPSSGTEPLLALRGAHFAYTDEKRILTDVTLSVPPGAFISLCGDNGAGKSTLLKGLLGLLPPRSGERWVSETLAREGIGYVAQSLSLPSDMPGNVEEVLRSGFAHRLSFWQRGHPAYERRLETLRRAFELDPLWREAFRSLSGGQKKRVLIARALLASETLIVLDEPAAGLDAENTERIETLLQHVNQTMKTTIIQVTHDREWARRASTHLWHVGGQCVTEERLHAEGNPS